MLKRMQCNTVDMCKNYSLFASVKICYFKPSDALDRRDLEIEPVYLPGEKVLGYLFIYFFFWVGEIISLVQ